MSLADGKDYLNGGVIMSRFLSPRDRRRLRRANELASHNHRVALARRQAIAIQEIEARAKRLDAEEQARDW